MSIIETFLIDSGWVPPGEVAGTKLPFLNSHEWITKSELSTCGGGEAGFLRLTCKNCDAVLDLHMEFATVGCGDDK